MNPRTPYIYVCAGALAAICFPTAATADESLSIGLSAEHGACFEDGEAVSTQAVSGEYRLGLDNIDASGYVRWAPTALDCARDGVTADVQVERRWERGPWRAVTQFGAETVATVGAWSLNGDGAVWRYGVDGTPVFAAAFGVGAELGDFYATLAANALPTDWVDGSAHGLRAAAKWTPELLGGSLLLEVSTEAARRFSGLAQWHRSFGDGPLGVTVSYRAEAGLDELAPPFEATLPGGWRLAPGSGRTDWFEVALAWDI
ncbi:MAG: hypothetical protein OXB97_04615 [Rhodospirillales bacterium]|nr:hypothetical protein [Rhodospirillales bacterium]